jgi:hypothetical protein
VDAPTNLVVSVSGDSVALQWIAPSAPVQSYAITAGSTAGSDDLARIATGTAETSFSVSGVPAGTYYVRVLAIIEGGTSSPSNEVVVQVGGGVFEGRFAAAFTGNAQVPVIAADATGAQIAAIADGQVGLVGALFTTPDRRSLFTRFGPNGLPTRAVIGDVIFVFDAYTATTVDVAVLTPDGGTHIARAVPRGRTATQALRVRVTGAAIEAEDLASWLNALAFGIELTGCVAATAEAFFGAVPSVGASFAIAAAGCASTVVDFSARVTRRDNPELARTRDAIGRFANLYGCAAGNFFDCAAGAVKSVADLITRYEAAERERIDNAFNTSCQRPAPPSGFASIVTGSTVGFMWNPPLSPPGAYLLEAGTSPGASGLLRTAISGEVTAYTATNVPPGSYYVRLRVSTRCGTSDPSNEVFLTVGPSQRPSELILRNDGSVWLQATVYFFPTACTNAGCPGSVLILSTGNLQPGQSHSIEYSLLGSPGVHTLRVSVQGYGAAGRYTLTLPAGVQFRSISADWREPRPLAGGSHSDVLDPFGAGPGIHVYTISGR